MFPFGKLPPPTIDPKTKKPKAHPRRLGVPVAAVMEGRTVTDNELNNLAKLLNERPEQAIIRCAKMGRLPDWIPAEMVPSEVLQAAVKANPVAANVPGSPTETVSTYAERWLDWRDKRGYTSIDNNRSALKQLLCIEVEPNITLAERPIATVSRADCKAVASYLRKCYLEKRFGKLSAYKYWGVLYSMITDSSEEGGEDDLMVRPDNPIRSVKGLDRPQPGTRGCLYASEFLKLITCEQIPLASRRVIVLAVYLQMRASELFRIRCEDLDLEREKISIRRGWDSYRKKEKLTKNGKTRIFEIPAPLLPLLRVMVAERGGTGLLLETSPYYVSHCFKAYLDAAGLHRWELRTRTETHTPLTLHGLRATGATWLACVEGNPLRLRRILGHSDQKTTDRYIDDSQLLGRNVGELFPSLPAELLGANRSGNRSDPLKNSGKPASSFLRRPAGGQGAKPPITNKASSRSALVRARSERANHRVRPQFPSHANQWTCSRFTGAQFNEHTCQMGHFSQFVLVFVRDDMPCTSLHSPNIHPVRKLARATGYFERRRPRIERVQITERHGAAEHGSCGQ